MTIQRHEIDFGCGGYAMESRDGEWVRYRDLQKWISVKRRPPKTSGVYLVCEDGVVRSAWFSGGKNGFWGHPADRPTHWMPLPEPPE